MASSVVAGTTSSQGRPQRTKKKQFTLYEPIYVIWPNGKNYPVYITKIFVVVFSNAAIFEFLLSPILVKFKGALITLSE